MPWNAPGVDYPVGHYTADASLKDPIKDPPKHCSYNSALRWLSCDSGAVIEHYRFNGIGLYSPTRGPLVVRDNHFTMTAALCQFYRGTAQVNTMGDLTLTSNTFDFDDGCSIIAETYKTPADPGLVTQASGVATLSGTLLIFSEPPSGSVRVGQYIDCPGCAKPARIIAGSDLNWRLNVSQPSLENVLITTGPSENVQNGAAFNGGKLIAKYNADLGWGQFLNPGQAPADVDVRFNFGKLLSRSSQHVNFMVKIPAPGTINSYVQNFNTIYWDKSARRASGTSTLDQFATLGISGGTTVTVSHQAKNNIIIANRTSNGGAGPTVHSMLRYLSQGGAAASDAKFDGSLRDGILTVSRVISGNPVEVGEYVLCRECTKPVQILSFGTGVGKEGTYRVSNNVDVRTFSKAGVFRFPGVIKSLDWQQNYFDLTGANTAFGRDAGLVVVGTETIAGNINMASGKPCNPGTGNC